MMIVMAESSEKSFEFPIPPANFAFLVESILMQAQMQLGLLNFGDKPDEQPEPNLPLARHSIDMLAMLQDKTRGNLTTEEGRLLENGLTELRFRYVQIAEEAKKAKAPESRIEIPTAASEEKAEPKGPLIITPDGGKGSKTE